MLGAVRLLAALILLLAAAPTFAAKRVALVIGNDQYDSLPDLQKAVNDARAVGGALKSLGYDVIAGENLNRRDMNRRLADLESAIAPGDDVFFFFSGHGVALGAENYLLPVDMPSPQPGEEGLVRNEGHAADAIIRAIQRRGAGVSFVVLDACRDNPFSETGTKDIGLSRGLSRIDAPAGVFVLFSAGIGQTALDRLSNADPDPNSVFTRKLVPLLGQAGLTHIDLAKQVQEEVAALAATIKHAQAPAYYDQIIGRVVLKAGEKAAPASPEVTALAEQVKTLRDELARQKQEAPKEQPVAVLKPEPPAKPLSGCDNLLVKVGTNNECLKPGDVFRDFATGPEMVVLPVGSFIMGSPANEGGRSDDEGPQHLVTIARPFAVGKFEVTFAEWDACAANGGCQGNRNPSDIGWGRGKRPVINISWDDAREYVRWLSEKTGSDYNLLTEAEWEYAARAGTTTPFHSGRTITPDQANFNGNGTYGGSAKGRYREKTVDVGSFKPNAFGLHDLHGNVWEWTGDCYKDSYRGAPSDGSANSTVDCKDRVLRGGSWFNNPQYLRSALRFRIQPGNLSYDLGLRVARTL